MGNKTIYGETEYLRKYTVIKSFTCLGSRNGGQIVVGCGWLRRARAAQSSCPDWPRVRRNPLWGFSIIPATSLVKFSAAACTKTNITYKSWVRGVFIFQKPGMWRVFVRTIWQQRQDVWIHPHRECGLHKVRLWDRGTTRKADREMRITC